APVQARSPLGNERPGQSEEDEKGPAEQTSPEVPADPPARGRPFQGQPGDRVEPVPPEPDQEHEKEEGEEPLPVHRHPCPAEEEEPQEPEGDLGDQPVKPRAGHVVEDQDPAGDGAGEKEHRVGVGDGNGRPGRRAPKAGSQGEQHPERDQPQPRARVAGTRGAGRPLHPPGRPDLQDQEDQAHAEPSGDEEPEGPVEQAPEPVPAPPSGEDDQGAPARPKGLGLHPPSNPSPVASRKISSREASPARRNWARRASSPPSAMTRPRCRTRARSQSRSAVSSMWVLTRMAAPWS